jgi:hypothetical protein
VRENDIEEAAQNIRILVREELETGHRLAGHRQPVAGCPVCESHGSTLPPWEFDRG